MCIRALHLPGADGACMRSCDAAVIAAVMVGCEQHLHQPGGGDCLWWVPGRLLTYHIQHHVEARRAVRRSMRERSDKNATHACSKVRGYTVIRGG
jgi:hypothetical protein